MKFIKTASFAATAMIAVGLSASANAQFSGYYDHANWTLTVGGDGGSTVVSADASHLLMTTGDTGSGFFSFADYWIFVESTGTISFDWTYDSLDDPGFDRGGYFLNGIYTTLSDTDGEFGSEAIAVNAGDTFGFFTESDDNLFGEGLFEVTNFNAAVPEPGTFVAVGVGLAALVARRRRK